MTRSEARCEAFKLIFQIEAQGEDYPHMVELFAGDNQALKKTDKKQFVYIQSVSSDIFSKLSDIDSLIEKNLTTDWKMQRLSRVSLAILRLAAYELMYMEDVPDNVAANEAVELAKVYDEDAAPAFINGVLSGIIKSKA